MLYLGLVDDETGEEYDYDQYDQYSDRPGERGYGEGFAETPGRGRPARQPVAAAVRAEPRRAPARQPAYEPAPGGVAVLGEPYRITTVQPRTYNEARLIGEQYREGVPVIINLTEMEDADAKRLVDFCAGLIFGLRGSIERVTNKVFLLSPSNVEVSAEDKARIATGGFFNQS